jgi:uncharacterized coiled-coil DUF342 family protein
MSSNSDERRRFVSKQIKIENLKEIKDIVKECNILHKRIEEQSNKIKNSNNSINDYIRERDELIRLREPLLEEYKKIRKKQDTEKYAKSIACSLIDEYNNSSGGGKKSKKIKKNKISVKAPKKKKKPTKYSR